MLAMNNCPSNNSKLTQNILRNLNIKVNIITKYSLALAYIKFSVFILLRKDYEILMIHS